MKKRFVSLLLVLCMVLAMVPSVLAFDSSYTEYNENAWRVNFSAGSGEFANGEKNITVYIPNDADGNAQPIPAAAYPDAPTLDGYVFAGWTKDGAAYDKNAVVDGEFTLEAAWDEDYNDYDEHSWRVYFQAGEGQFTDGSKEVVIYVPLVEGAAQTIPASAYPANPTRAGYTFNGWYCNGTAFDEETLIDQEYVLTASWTKNESKPPVVEDDEYRVYISTSAHGSVETKYGNRWYEEGDKVWLKVEADKGYELSALAAYCDYWYDHDWDWDYEHYHSECDCPFCDCYYCGDKCDCDYCNYWYWHDCDYDCGYDCDWFEPSRWFEYDCPNHAYDCDDYWWWGYELKLTYQGNGWYTFIMPDCDVYVDAEFEKIGYAYNGDLPFYDVPYNAWYYGAVDYAYDHDLMTGTDYRTFSPNMGATRGMIATILYRLTGEPTVTYGSGFSDVVRGSYCEDAVAWAAGKGIVEGYPDGTFGPNDLVTREQLVSILYRFADYEGYRVDDYATLAGFYDADSVRAFALKPMKWAVAKDLVNGNEYGRLVPGATATRAEIAQLLKAFCENVWYK